MKGDSERKTEGTDWILIWSCARSLFVGKTWC